MVVVLDALESEKVEFDYGEEDIVEASQLLVTNSNYTTSSPSSLRKSRPGWRLSRRGQWVLRTVAAFAITFVVFGNLVGVEEDRKEKHESASAAASNAGKNRDNKLGPLGVMLNPEVAEKLFLKVPNVKHATEVSRSMTNHPHIAGSEEDFEDAKRMLDLFQTFFGIPNLQDEPIFSAGSPESRRATLGIPELSAPRAWIDTYYPVMNTPLNRSLEILDADGDVLWAADVEEVGDPEDVLANKFKNAVPTFHGLSKDGEVEGELLYANYGRKEDYDELEASGVDFSGKIVLVRYGAIFRGLKIKGAQERGAAGVLVYSDPRDDGAVTVENGYVPYPQGPARNPYSVQRGSVQFISLYPGDPTTPGYPAYENATRAEPINQPSIPSLPISWSNAERLLEELGAGDQRVLNGQSSSRKVKLVNHVDDKVTPIWNTMAVIPGHIKDEVVMIGNHRDAWVLGGADPTSGTVSLHEIIRAFGTLLRSGWKPLRTILIASWDAEEYGLVGSTEWGEDFADWIKKHVVAYLNTDVASAGSRYDIQASPSLAHAIVKIAQDLPHPTKDGKTLWDAVNDHGPFEGEMDAEFKAEYLAKEMKKAASKTGVAPLGSGSDYTVFLQRIGVASSDQGFAQSPYDAPYHYHSIYDSERWQEKYADPGFHRHLAISKSLGLLTLRMADSVVLPLNTTQYAYELDEYLDVVEALTLEDGSSLQFSALRQSIESLKNASTTLDIEKAKAEAHLVKLLEHIRRNGGTHTGGRHGNAVWEGIRRVVGYIFGFHPPRHHRHEDFFNDEFSDFLGSVDRDDSEIAQDGFPDHHTIGSIPAWKLKEAIRRVRRVNKLLSSFESGFISEDGIKDRDWYRHLGVAPGKWLGYGATTFPALTEAITIEQNSTLAEYEAARLQSLIGKLASQIRV